MLTHLKFFLYSRKLAGMPMTNGVGASNSCNRQHNCLFTHTNTRFFSNYSVYALSSLHTVPHRTLFKKQNCFCSLHNIYINSLPTNTEISCSYILSFKIQCGLYSQYKKLNNNQLQPLITWHTPISFHKTMNSIVILCTYV